MSLLGVIASLSTPGPYTVTRAASGTYTKGQRVAGAAPTTFAIVASVQPVLGAELMDLPEGQRGDEVRVAWTTTFVWTARPGFEADEITLDGEQWIAIRARRYEAFGGTHYEVYFARAKVSP